MNNFKKELNRYLNDNKDKYDDKVIEYGINFIKKIEKNDIIKEYFNINYIGIYTFLSELLTLSQYKLNFIGKEELDQNEINKVLGGSILNNEILKLLLNDKIFIYSINSENQIIYELSDDAINYFYIKYGIKLDKKFSFNDIKIFNVDDEIDDDNISSFFLN